MDKITLLGDSIRMIGYGYAVADALKGRYEVFQPEDNCRFAKYTLRLLFDYKDNIAGSKIIHWNNGLWDVSDLFGDGKFSSIEEYTQNILRIARILLKITPNVIFATTTPVRGDYPYQSNKDIAEFNSAVVPKLKEMGIQINDLNAVVSENIDEYIRGDDKIHLTEKGIEVCTKKVLESIEAMERKINKT